MTLWAPHELQRATPGRQLRKKDITTLYCGPSAPPCKTIRDSFIDGSFTKIAAKVAPNLTRWYAKVLNEGQVRIGENVVLN